MGIIGNILLSLLANELDRLVPPLARLMVRQRARRLPGLADRMEEEWLAEVAARDSHLHKLGFAIGLFWREAGLDQAAEKCAKANEVPVPSGGAEIVGTIVSTPIKSADIIATTPDWQFMSPQGAQRVHPARLSAVFNPLLPPMPDESQGGESRGPRRDS